ncbi:MAG TPA: hypothetical protein VH092_10250 [Urbifossiella sp.]|nr:hypothetical protein [Urbifossiella sp.]
MGWERRKRGPGTGYYYKSVRTPGGGVKKVYLGRGQAGHEAAAEMERRRRDREEARNLVRADRDGATAADRLAAEQREWAAVLTTVWMILTGHHRHRGEWRSGRGA